MDYGKQLNLLHAHNVEGTSSADTMVLTNSSTTTLSPAAGNDVIMVQKGNIKTVVKAGAGKDSINNAATGTQVYGEAGNDTIVNSGSNSTLDGGADNDYISNLNGGSVASILGGTGNDTILNQDTSGYNAYLSGGDGNDLIKHNAINSTIDAGLGNDLIYLGEDALDNVIVYSGGSDTIFGYNTSNVIDLNNATITARETIGSDLKITTNTGSILLKNASSITPELGNIGGDSTSTSTGVINNRQNGIVITGTANDDTINNYANNVTINALAGDDFVLNRGSRILVDLGDGDDTLDTTWNSTDRVTNATIYAGKGNDHISMMYNADDSFIDLNDGDDYFYGSGKNTTILGGAGNDFIRGDGNYYNYIDTGDGINTVHSGSIGGTVIAGAGNDSLLITGNNSTVFAGAGNDTIYIYDNGSKGIGNNVTVNASTGNDIFTLSSSISGTVIDVAAGDGDDSIYGYNPDNTIHITSGEIKNKTTSGNDIILTISDGTGTGTITLKDSATISAITVMDSLGAISTIGSGVNVTISTPSTTTDGTDYDDYIVIKNPGAANSTVNSRGGNDTIDASGLTSPTSSNAVIYAGTGDDVVHVSSRGSTVDAGEGNDSISMRGFYNSGKDYQNDLESYGGNNRAIGGAGDDTIDNDGSTNSTIEGGEGNDLINNNAPRASILGGAGADSITNNKPYSTIYGGADNDRIVNTNISGYNVSGTKAVIYGDEGDDYIYNTADSVSVYGGAGDDTIINTHKGSYTPVGEYSYLDGGDGADYIKNTEENVTIVGGKGDDTIVNSGSNTTYVYGAGDGNDVIDSWHSGDKISLTSGTITNVSVSGSTVILGIGDSSLTIKKGKDQDITLVDPSGKEITTVISGTSTYTTGSTIPTGLSYNEDRTVLTVSDKYTGALEPANYYSTVDTIKAGGRSKAIAITGNANDNSIIGGSGKDTLNGGAGEDTLVGGKGNDILNGGEGNDVLNGGAGNDTLTGGAGNDTFMYASGDGNDVITDIGTGADLFKISSGSISAITTSKKNSDVVLTIGKGKVTFKDALTKTIAVEDKDGSKHSIVGGVNVIEVQEPYSSTTGLGGSDSIKSEYLTRVSIYGGEGNDTIINRAYNYTHGLLDGGAGNDYINDIYSYYDTILGGAGNDTVDIFGWGIGTVVDAGVGNDSIGIVDGGAVSVNAGAGNDIIHAKATGNTIIGGKGNDTIECDTKQYSQIVENVIQYASGDGNDVIDNYTENAAILQITNGEITKVATGGKKNPTDVVFTIGKGTVTFKNAAGKNISVIDSKGNQTTRTYGATLVAASDSTSDTIDVSKEATVLEVDASSRSKGVTIIGNTKNNTISGGFGDDVLTGGKGKDVFIFSGGNDTITDYTAGQDIIKFSSDTYLVDASLSAVETGADIVFYTNNGSLTIKKAVKLDKKDNYTGNKITVIDGDGINTGAQLYDQSDVTVANADGNTIKANVEVINVNANKHSKALYLMGNGNDNSLLGGGGADTIVGFGGNDILTGGKGKDTFVFSVGEGNDTITDYTVKQDKIQIASGVISTYTVSGKDVIFSISDTTTASTNYLTVNNGKDKAITIIDSTGKETSETYNDPKELILTSKDSGTFNMNDSKYSQILIVDGTKTTKGVELIANVNGNTLMGGKGKDILTGGLGADTFVYTTGGGNDTITNYVAGEDVIQLGKKTNISQAVVKEITDEDGKVVRADWVFTIGKGKLTVEDGATKTITFKDSNGYKIRYDADYTSTSIGYEERFYDEVLADDNFITSDLDAITKSDNLIAVDYKIPTDNNFINNEVNQILADDKSLKK